MSWINALPTLHEQSRATSAEVIKTNTPNDWLYPLDTFSILEIAGPDRFSFLQGQVTCDAQRLEQGESLLGAHLNLQGRIEASFIAIPTVDRLQLIMAPEQAAHLKSLLAKYALFSQVTMEENPDALPYFYWSASTSAERGYRDQGSNSLHFGVTNTQLLPSLIEGRDIGKEVDALAILFRNGFYLVSKDQRGQYLPQELNYDHLDGISFKKGCYKGQEVVARIHFKGQVKQRVHPYTSTADTPIKSKIVSAAGTKCGEVISTTHLSDHGPDSFGCILLKSSETESKTAHLEQNDGAELQLLDRPYAIT